jgi:hypothetical protein
VPLMMTPNYRATGWLGLLLGSRLYFRFDTSTVGTETLFEQQMDAVERELAGRGKIIIHQAGGKGGGGGGGGARVGVAEGVPPAQTGNAVESIEFVQSSPAPAPAPAPVPEPAPAPAPAATVPTTSVSMKHTHWQQQPSPAPAVVQQRGDDHTLALLQLLLEREERTRQEAKAEKAELRQEARAEKAEMDAKLDRLREELRPKPPADIISDEALSALQSRLVALHAAKLCNDEQLYELEDLCADYVELKTAAPGGIVTHELAGMAQGGAAWRLVRLARLSEAIEKDSTFARQAIRKFCTRYEQGR